MPPLCGARGVALRRRGNDGATWTAPGLGEGGTCLSSRTRIRQYFVARNLRSADVLFDVNVARGAEKRARTGLPSAEPLASRQSWRAVGAISRMAGNQTTRLVPALITPPGLHPDLMNHGYTIH